MRTAIILAGLLVFAGIGVLAADPVAAEDVDCTPHVGPGYVVVTCDGPVRACVFANFDGAVRHCA